MAVNNCVYDNQTSFIGDALARGLPTIDMLGYNLFSFFGFNYFLFEENLYPRSGVSFPPFGGIWYHPIDLISAAPIRLDAGDRADSVRRNFNVTNY